jgi:hypothetical protein
MQTIANCVAVQSDLEKGVWNRYASVELTDRFYRSAKVLKVHLNLMALEAEIWMFPERGNIYRIWNSNVQRVLGYLSLVLFECPTNFRRCGNIKLEEIQTAVSHH